MDMLEEALRAYKTALDLKPNAPDYLAGIAATYCMLRRFTDGLNFAEKVLAFTPSLELALLSQANALLSLGQMTEALASVEKAVPVHPHSLQAHNWRSRILVLMGQQPDEAEAHYNRAFALLTLGRLEEGWLGYDYRTGQSACPAGADASAWSGAAAPVTTMTQIVPYPWRC